MVWTTWIIYLPSVHVTKKPIDGQCSNMLDVVVVAAFVIWISLNDDWCLNDQRGQRHKFLKQLGQELIDDYIQVRLQNPRILWPNVRITLKMIGKLAICLQPAPETDYQPRKCCMLCPTRIDKETLHAMPNTNWQENAAIYAHHELTRKRCMLCPTRLTRKRCMLCPTRLTRKRCMLCPTRIDRKAAAVCNRKGVSYPFL